MTLIDLLDRPVAYQRCFAWLGIGVTGALMLSQAVYWSKRTSDKDGWFYKSQEEWEEETGLSRTEQETARKRLIKAGVMEEDRRGLPARLFYRVKAVELEAKLLAATPQKSRLRKSCNQECRKPAGMSAGKLQAGLQETGEQVSGDPAIIHTEITTETTTDILSGAGNPAPVAGCSGAPAVLSNGQQEDQKETAFQGKCRETWKAYGEAYNHRYGIPPVRNAKINTLVKNLVQRLGADAPAVAAFYVQCVNEAFVVRKSHDLGTLVASAESYRTQWATGRTMTQGIARQIDSTQTNASVADEAIRLLREREARK